MLNVSRDQMVAAFEELVGEDQIQTAMDLLVSADPEDQLIVTSDSSPTVLYELFQALDAEDRREVTRRLSGDARNSLFQALTPLVESGTLTGADLDARELRELFASTPNEEAMPLITPGLVATPVAGRKDFALINGRLLESSPETASVTVYSNPSGPAQLQLLESLEIDEHTLASVLDPEEIARLEYDEADQMTFIVWNRPRREADEHPEVLKLSSVGIFLQPGRLTIITADEALLLRAGDKADSLQDVLLRLMAATVNEFLVELKSVKRTSREIQAELSTSIASCSGCST